MTAYAKLMFVAAQHDDCNMDLFVHATDFLHAVRMWKQRFPASEITWPEKLVVFTMPCQRAEQGVVEWRDLHHIEINPRDVV
jgi:hypothetical protein